jgi:hypothetical protein
LSFIPQGLGGSKLALWAYSGRNYERRIGGETGDFSDEMALQMQEPLFKAFADKVPKTVVAALDVVTQAFG